MTKIAAVILTGSRDQHNILLSGTGLSSKTLLPVGEKPMVQWVFDALSATAYKPRLYVSTNDPAIEQREFGAPALSVPSGTSAVSSFLQAIDNVSADTEWVILASGDHVLLTPEMVTYFVEEAQRRQLTLAVSVVAKSTVQAHYPNSKRTYMPLKGDAYSGANLYMVHKPSFSGQRRVLETIDQNRKKPWKSVFMMDWFSIVRVFARQVDIHELATLASKTIGCKTGCVVLPFAEACMDVDKPSDKEIAETIIEHRKGLHLVGVEKPEPDKSPDVIPISREADQNDPFKPAVGFGALQYIAALLLLHTILDRVF
ncbi:MAG: nucleotidyltransferase family protein [Vampirovibrionales bacterium]|nr:nucleotidyltransferase family protein [Vampirovibrionales bacterium]